MARARPPGMTWNAPSRSAAAKTRRPIGQASTPPLTNTGAVERFTRAWAANAVRC